VSAVALLLELREAGVAVDVVEGRIRCRHRPEALSPDLAERVRGRRSELLTLLADPAALREAVARWIFEAEADGATGMPTGKAIRVATRGCYACGQERDVEGAVCQVCHPRRPARPRDLSGGQESLVVGSRDERKVSR